ncbi:MAG: hypothetical protein R3D33_03365 [Hyphomicrobiaceae bacterium]
MITTLVILLLLAALGGGAWYFRGYLTGGAGGGMFGGQRDRRIGVSEIAAIDGRRKLLLIHRDGVEHLVMTGGPIDVVIEQGIQPMRRQSYDPRQAMPIDGGGVDQSQSGAGFGRLRQRMQPTFDQQT